MYSLWRHGIAAACYEAVRWLSCDTGQVLNPLWSNTFDQLILTARVAVAAGDAGLRARALRSVELLERDSDEVPLFSAVIRHTRGILERDAAALVDAADDFAHRSPAVVRLRCSGCRRGSDADGQQRPRSRPVQLRVRHICRGTCDGGRPRSRPDVASAWECNGESASLSARRPAGTASPTRSAKWSISSPTGATNTDVAEQTAPFTDIPSSPMSATHSPNSASTPAPS